LVVEHAEDPRGGSSGVGLLPDGGTKAGLLRIGHEEDIGHSVEVETVKDSSELVTKSAQSTTTDNTPFETTGLSHSAAMSQMAIVPEDVGVDEKVMPSGLSDINGHQLDLRKTNSW
jgi:hypothetical protein